MKKISRILLVVASLLLIGSLFLPLWKITLDAPQYPEGLGLYIWSHSITGEKPNDLRNINGLNHYIGMKLIEPTSIPELKIMPFIIAFLSLLGLLAAILNKKGLLYTWMILFILLGIVGLADFYKWEYDYGHNLNPHAAIKVPGMAYQPPLIGSKKLLNFNATSIPAAGGWLLFGSIALGLAAIYLSTSKSSKNQIKQEASNAQTMGVLGSF
ncbi:MAG: hypothetical protein D6814_05545 [Calditrichaeota bacterium]|nr:MAG: hypothetical protein D6814_05545 [Calditrichota bacterium]